MIPSGILKYKLQFYQVNKILSESGFFTKTKELILSAKAAKTKVSGNFDINGKENFYSENLQFKLRYNKLINNELIVNYNDYDYKIVFFDIDKNDNSILLNLEKINE